MPNAQEVLEWIKFDKERKANMTNEQWFCQLPTAEKSEFLSAMVKQAIKVYEIHGCTWHETVSWWDGWLKEKHE
jgi:hypothetical protein